MRYFDASCFERLMMHPSHLLNTPNPLEIKAYSKTENKLSAQAKETLLFLNKKAVSTIIYFIHPYFSPFISDFSLSSYTHSLNHANKFIPLKDTLFISNFVHHKSFRTTTIEMALSRRFLSCAAKNPLSPSALWSC